MPLPTGFNVKLKSDKPFFLLTILVLKIMMIIIIKQLYEIGGNVLSVCVCGVCGV